MVAGMAYLVRRLLENTSNESFLGDQQRGVPIEELLAAAVSRAVRQRADPGAAPGARARALLGGAA